MHRREFLKGALLGVGSAVIGSSMAKAATINDADVSSLALRITYTTEILRQPAGKAVRIWIPVPLSDREQEISDFSVNSRLSYAVNQADQSKCRLLFVDGEVKQGDKIILRYKVKRKAVGLMNDPQEDPKRHLQPSEWEKWDPEIARFVDALVGAEKDPLKIGRKIYDAIIDRTNYIHEACGRGVSTFTFEDKVGRCDEFHALFRSMMMYKGIPVKWEQGLLLPYASVMQKKGKLEADCISAHSWVKFHAGGGRWVPADLSEAKRRPELRDFYFGRITPNRIRMSCGREVTLKPSQEGILNTFPYGYAEADGAPLIYSHEYRNELQYELAGMETRTA
jgi:transglutaminase-like putative cysteine protease